LRVHHTWDQESPSTAELGYAASVNRDAGPSEPLAFGAGRATAGQPRTGLTHYLLAMLRAAATVSKAK